MKSCTFFILPKTDEIMSIRAEHCIYIKDDMGEVKFEVTEPSGSLQIYMQGASKPFLEIEYKDWEVISRFINAQFANLNLKENHG